MHANDPAPPVPAAEPVEPAPAVPTAKPLAPAAVPSFSPALFEQLVQRVAAEVTKQLQPVSSSSAVQEPRVASPASAALPSLAGMTAIQQLTTEIPVVNSSAVDTMVPSVPVGTAASVDHVAQVVQSVTKPKKIVSFDNWVQAFHVFTGVYTSRFPNDGPSLMKYGATIQDLAAKGLNWRFYDENFRFLQQIPATSLPMGYHSLGALAPLTKPG